MAQLVVMEPQEDGGRRRGRELGTKEGGRELGKKEGGRELGKKEGVTGEEGRVGWHWWERRENRSREEGGMEMEGMGERERGLRRSE